MAGPPILDDLKSLATASAPFGPEEAEKVVTGLRCLAGESSEDHIDWDALKMWLQSRAHLEYKNWDVTEESGVSLGKVG